MRSANINKYVSHERSLRFIKRATRTVVATCTGRLNFERFHSITHYIVTMDLHTNKDNWYGFKAPPDVQA